MFAASLLGLMLVVPQNPWVVDALGRPGANFTDLPPAVAAASPGDTIVVRSVSSTFNYSAFSVSGKELKIRGEGAANTRCAGATISTMPLGSVFFIEGMTVVALVARSTSLVLSSSATTSIDLAFGARASLSDCTCRGDRNTPPMVLSSGSTLVAQRSRFVSRDYSGSATFNCTSFGSACAIRAIDATVILYDCWAIGGWSLFSFPEGSIGCRNSYFAHEGIDLTRSTLRVAGESSILSGAPSIRFDASSLATVHGSSILVGFSHPQLRRHSTVLPDLRVAGSALASGAILAANPVTVTLTGGISAAPTLLAFATTPPVATDFAPLSVGEVMLPFSSYFLSAVLDGAGQFTVTLPGSQVPWIGVPVFGQAAVLDVAGGRALMSNLEFRAFTY